MLVPVTIDRAALAEPILCGVPCGPGLVPYRVSETLADYLIPHDRCRVVKVVGESMAALNIWEGDVLVFDERRPPRHGDVVMVVMESGEHTVKRYEPESEPPGLYGYGLGRTRDYVRVNEAVIIGVLTKRVEDR